MMDEIKAICRVAIGITQRPRRRWNIFIAFALYQEVARMLNERLAEVNPEEWIVRADGWDCRMLLTAAMALYGFVRGKE